MGKEFRSCFMIKVFKSNKINDTDTIEINGKKTQISLDGANDTNRDLILLYMYVLPDFTAHGVKVGMVRCKSGKNIWNCICKRVEEQKNELALSVSDYECYGSNREVVYWGVCLDAKNESFKDYRVHDEILALDEYKGLLEKEQEWFINVPVAKLIESFEKLRETSDRAKREVYTPRKEQRECVDTLLKYFSLQENKKGGKFLLNCKMRFGKSYTAYKFAEEANLKKILILTFIPAVEDSWRDDLSHIETDYDYYTDDDLKKDDFEPGLITDKFVMFLSLQNYLGKGNDKKTKAKIAKLQSIEWDLLILDEYHFGAWNERTQGTFERLEDLDKDYQNELKKTGDVVERFKIRTNRTICLSGTPFKAIAKGEFVKDNTFTYSYFDEQKNKYPQSESDDFSTADKNYAHFPDMKIIGYNMSELFSALGGECQSADKILGRKYFSLNSFFRTENEENYTLGAKFVYENGIRTFLEILKGRTTYPYNFPYADRNKDVFNKINHSLWLLPTVQSVCAMAELLKKDDYFKKYEIINLSAPAVGAGRQAYKVLQSGIKSSVNKNALGSICLTVNKLTTGVTVKEWSAVFVLKDLASAESYFQSIFRVQTPQIKNGEIAKKDAFVFDFNIDRAASLMLDFARNQERQNSAVRLNVAKLIVRYLPIFINGDMSSPIAESVFYELAQFGDSSSKPLSRKISDTSKTTRALDDETISCMLNDKDCADIIKRVFAHAKLKTDKKGDRTKPLAPSVDGYNTLMFKKGMDEGYKKGVEDSEKYLDFDDYNIQKAFDENEKKYMTELLPTIRDYDDAGKTYWLNGFRKGFESGVNAPVRKMKCGAEDGIKFVEVIRQKFGENITWNERIRADLKNFINMYLNKVENIPEMYRGAIYKRWYCDSFLRAIQRELTLKIKAENGEALSDVDNCLRHILSRLFEFLYISVYRETTFNQVFENANAETFLEAVCITKKEFEVLNKYHIFQENVLNNYIHEFFVNESLGERLNLDNENIRRNYRNSFDYFGFGVEEAIGH